MHDEKRQLLPFQRDRLDRAGPTIDPQCVSATAERTRELIEDAAPDTDELALAVVHAFGACSRIEPETRSAIDGAQVRVCVEDDGKGMAEDQLRGLFDVELDAAGRVKARFGLPTCRSVVYAHGGEIDVKSQPGRGTTFTIVLPFTVASAIAGR